MPQEKNKLLRIDQVFMAVSVDKDGNEGVCARYDGHMGWMPLVAADEARLVNIKQWAAEIAVERNQLVRIIKLHTREEIDFFDGRQPGGTA